MTALVVVLIARPIVPFRLTPVGSATVTSPLSEPAMPALVANSSPVPAMMVAPVAAVPSVTLTLVAAIDTAEPPPGNVVASTARDAWKVCVPPNRLTVTPSSSTRTYGPAGRSTGVPWPATVTEWGAVVVLTSTVSVPPLMVTPATVVVTWALTLPAMPPAVTTNVPLPPVTDTSPEPSESDTPLAAMLTPSVIGVKAKLPASVWPAIEIWPLVSAADSSGVVWLPDARSTVTPGLVLPAMAIVWLTAAPVSL